MTYIKLHCNFLKLNKFVAKLLEYRILFMDILTFLGLDYKEASVIPFYYVVLGITIPKI